MNRSYSKIRHIQEANVRLEKRMLSEQPVDTYDPVLKRLGNSSQENTPHPDPIADRMFNKLKSYGFVNGGRLDKMIDSKGRYITIEKPNSGDYDGISVTFDMREEPFDYVVFVIQGGKVLVDKKGEINSLSPDKLDGMIMNELKPYLSMKIRPIPSGWGSDMYSDRG
jgi:hypothetical protein